MGRVEERGEARNGVAKGGERRRETARGTGYVRSNIRTNERTVRNGTERNGTVHRAACVCMCMRLRRGEKREEREKESEREPGRDMPCLRVQRPRWPLSGPCSGLAPLDSTVSYLQEGRRCASTHHRPIFFPLAFLTCARCRRESAIAATGCSSLSRLRKRFATKKFSLMDRWAERSLGGEGRRGTYSVGFWRLRSMLAELYYSRIYIHYTCVAVALRDLGYIG